MVWVLVTRVTRMFREQRPFPHMFLVTIALLCLPQQIPPAGYRQQLFPPERSCSSPVEAVEPATVAVAPGSCLKTSPSRFRRTATQSRSAQEETDIARPTEAPEPTGSMPTMMAKIRCLGPLPRTAVVPAVCSGVLVPEREQMLDRGGPAVAVEPWRARRPVPAGRRSLQPGGLVLLGARG